MDMSVTEQLISVKEAAKDSTRSMETVRRWIWSGKLPAHKLGNQLFIKRSDWEIFLKYTNTQRDDRFRFIERATALRDKIRARIATNFDIPALIEESRQRRRL
jgi:excisionase family DNA binding protein